MTNTSDIKLEKVPNHIAVIMDGNGRWAKKRGMASELGVKYLTMYAFSTENWNRPKFEVDALMSLLISTLKKELPEFQRKQVKVNAIGNLNSLPKKAQKTLEFVISETKKNTGITLTFALSYGAREEIVNAIQNISKKVVNKEIEIGLMRNFILLKFYGQTSEENIFLRH